MNFDLRSVLSGRCFALTWALNLSTKLKRVNEYFQKQIEPFCSQIVRRFLKIRSNFFVTFDCSKPEASACCCNFNNLFQSKLTILRKNYFKVLIYSFHLNTTHVLFSNFENLNLKIQIKLLVSREFGIKIFKFFQWGHCSVSRDSVNSENSSELLAGIQKTFKMLMKKPNCLFCFILRRLSMMRLCRFPALIFLLISCATTTFPSSTSGQHVWDAKLLKIFNIYFGSIRDFLNKLTLFCC